MGETALHIAAQYNDGAMIQALLASHANLEELTVDSRSDSAFGSESGVGGGVLGLDRVDTPKNGRCRWVYIYVHRYYNHLDDAISPSFNLKESLECGLGQCSNSHGNRGQCECIPGCVYSV